ncbi:hypothetical protein sscle_16g111130 [Sclerotinia sclerotiorum 1980 UF-70]|uniref:Zn(2)-C6 fungal-type domain-containing protein n=2 Tax=Sclerotinia sclerotiorum (strain ATCC 18683 / 1980 / Ss-1) TaxID=665079 RepID=A0A1D9QNR0_SCLS1|nr:hypothetical protein sscle_16g111130 [Sclerotinia sclerotiorum 1980 UF-70]
MSAPRLISEKGDNRKIRPHKKSRRGCGNCKLRKVKCDETRPMCKRCTEFKVLCNYDQKTSALQLLDKSFTFETLQHRLPYSLNQTMPSIVNPGLRGFHKTNVYDLSDQEHLGILNRFQTRTVYTITTDRNLQIYQNEFIKLACLHPYLMHALLLFTLMHDRHLSIEQSTRMSPSETFHWSQSISLFSRKLSPAPIESSSERDALWATSILLGLIAFCNIESRTPQEAWPLVPPSSLDLNWLVMGYGKSQILKLVQDKKASAFRTLIAPETSALSTHIRLETLPQAFITVFDLHSSSKSNDNPYRLAVSLLSDVIDVDVDITVILKFCAFVGETHPQYKRLLFQKEPRALLLLAYWFGKLCQFPHWWIWRRASLECQAICIYLETFHKHDLDVQTLLVYPKIMSGL